MKNLLSLRRTSAASTTPVVAVTASVASEAAQPQPLLHHISRSFLAQTLIFQRRKKRVKKGDWLSKEREKTHESLSVNLSAWLLNNSGCRKKEAAEAAPLQQRQTFCLVRTTRTPKDASEDVETHLMNDSLTAVGVAQKMTEKNLLLVSNSQKTLQRTTISTLFENYSKYRIYLFFHRFLSFFKCDISGNTVRFGSLCWTRLFLWF